MSSFQDLGVFPKELRAVGVEQALSLSCNSTQHARNFFGLLPQGYCERKTPQS